MSRIYIALLAISAFVIAVTGAAFSIFGLAQLFSGASESVALMAGALEFAKLVVTGFLYRYWGHIHRPLKIYLGFAVITLVGITSVGIFGYLSSAYQKSSLDLKKQQLKLKTIEDEHNRYQTQISDMQKFIDDIPRTRISSKLKFQKEYAPQIKLLNKKSETLMDEASAIKLEILNTNTKIGPVIYLADALNTELDTVVKFLTLVFVLVFDPLAVCLVFCLNLAIRLREKYKGNEYKISSYSFSTPVDHRTRKSHLRRAS